MPIPGIHNIYNCLLAISIAHEIGIEQTVISKAIASFKGVKQRFTYCGTLKGKNVAIFDDYGHHPKEIEHTLKIAKKTLSQGRLIVLFQPHRFSRTKHLWNDFIDTFNTSAVDYLMITDIHPASEHPIENVSGDKMAQQIKKKTQYLPFTSNFENIITHINGQIKENDLLLVLGAGKINKLQKAYSLGKTIAFQPLFLAY